MTSLKTSLQNVYRRTGQQSCDSKLERLIILYLEAGRENLLGLNDDEVLDSGFFIRNGNEHRKLRSDLLMRGDFISFGVNRPSLSENDGQVYGYWSNCCDSGYWSHCEDSDIRDHFFDEEYYNNLTLSRCVPYKDVCFITGIKGKIKLHYTAKSNSAVIYHLNKEIHGHVEALIGLGVRRKEACLLYKETYNKVRCMEFKDEGSMCDRVKNVFNDARSEFLGIDATNIDLNFMYKLIYNHIKKRSRAKKKLSQSV